MADTLDEVAEIAGVSRATVSRVVNNSQKVSGDTREKVVKAIEESGYQPHAVAQSLAKNETGIIGLVIPESVSRLFSDPFFAPLIMTVTEECNERGYELMLSLLTTPDQEEELYGDIVNNSFLDGLLFASTPLEDPLVDELLRDEIPFVSVGRNPNEQVNYVDADNYGGARQATEYMLELGHEKIGTITGPLDQAAALDRLEGYKDALRDAGVGVESSLIYEGDFTEESGVRGVQELLGSLVSAIFVASDKMAIGALKALKKARKEIPEDVALVGFDDISASSAVEPPLTTISQPVEKMAETAVRILEAKMEQASGQEAEPIREVLDTKLIVRGST
ncbi:MAG: LacI family DNA-binding transcriptional regulator [Candidatus Bipolaricaulota bacterium]